MAVSWWARSLSPFMAWLQHSEHLSICGLCAGAGAGWRGPSQSAALSLSVARYWSRHGPLSLSSLSITSLATIRHRPPLDTRTHPGHSIIWIWPSADYFPWLTKHTRILSPGWWDRDADAGIIYTQLTPPSEHITRVAVEQYFTRVMSLFIVTNVRNIWAPGHKECGPRTRCYLVNLLKSHNLNISSADTDTHHHHRSCFKLKFLSHSHSSSRICAMWGTGHCCGILVTYQDPTFERSKS